MQTHVLFTTTTRTTTTTTITTSLGEPEEADTQNARGQMSEAKRDVRNRSVAEAWTLPYSLKTRLRVRRDSARRHAPTSGGKQVVNPTSSRSLGEATCAV